MSHSIDLYGQVALVTGGGRGIGRAAALALAASGAAVAVTARTGAQVDETVRMIQAAGGIAAGFPTDVSDPSAVDRLARDVAEAFGPVDLLVNNAGLPGPPGRDWEHDPERWWYVISVNVRGPYLLSRAVLPGMIERRRGRIINVLGSSAYLASPYNSAYTTSKAALYSMTRSLAAATREYGVSVFNYGPGLVRTELTEYLAGPESPPPAAQLMASALESDLRIEPEFSAQGMVYIASGQADAASGRYLDVRWGIPDMVARVLASRDDELYSLQLKM